MKKGTGDVIMFERKWNKPEIIQHGSTYTPPVENVWHEVVCPECCLDDTVTVEDDLHGGEYKAFYQTTYKYEIRKCSKCGCTYRAQTTPSEIELHVGTKWLIVLVALVVAFVVSLIIFGWNLVAVLMIAPIVILVSVVIANTCEVEGLDW
jgi:hypothetical protein